MPMAAMRRSGVTSLIDGTHLASQISMPNSICTTIFGSHGTIDPSTMPSDRYRSRTPISLSAHTDISSRCASVRYERSPKYNQ